MNALIRDVEALLAPGERALWVGRPMTGFQLRKEDIALIPFSLMWGGFSFFWEFMAIKLALEAPHASAWIMPLFGLPFVLIGYQFILGRFISDMRRRSRTIFIITGERILSHGPKGTMAWKLAEIHDLTLSERKRGAGDIYFQGPVPELAGKVQKRFRGISMSARSPFELVANAKEAFSALVEAREKAMARNPSKHE
ncbi:MAG TPA: hypothetical protein VEH27_10380 [Methylomirabilota bacterium]|nr:hypothetical protein [Methylomirabilota bacterium]